jgi:hypothetical protein
MQLSPSISSYNLVFIIQTINIKNNGGLNMKRNNSSRNNPNNLKSGSSIINNTLERLENENLEMAEDDGLLKDRKDIGNRPNKKQTKVNDTSKNIISNFKK